MIKIKGKIFKIKAGLNFPAFFIFRQLIFFDSR